MYNFAKRVTSAVVAGAVVLGTLAFFPVGNKGRVNAAAPELYDSTSAVNYKTILGGAVDYGIVCNDIHQGDHMETTYATNELWNPQYKNTDVDFITSPALFLIGSVKEGKPTFDYTRASAIYIEAPQEVFGSFDPSMTIPDNGGDSNVNPRFGNLKFGNRINEINHPTKVVMAVNPEASSNVDRLIKRISSNTIAEDVELGWSYFLNDRAHSDYVLNPNGTCSEIIVDTNSNITTININDPVYANRVVYINVTAQMLPSLAKSGSFIINKDDSTIVVFNIDDSIVSDSGLLMNKPVVHSSDGNTYVGTTARNGDINLAGYDDNSDGVKAADVQTHFNETIVWNVMTSKSVEIINMGGTMLFPNASSITTPGRK